MAGTSEAPVSIATRTKPRRFATTHQSVFGQIKRDSRIPPPTKPTAVDVQCTSIMNSPIL